MKKLLPLFFLLFGLTSAKGQILISILFGDKLNSEKVEFGLDGGLTFSNLNGFQSATPLRSLNLGFYFDIKMSERWYIKTGVQVASSVGIDKLTQTDVAILDPTFNYSDSGSFRQEVSYFHVPANAEYRFRNHIYLHGGPVVGLRNRSLLTFEGQDGSKDVVVSTKNGTSFHLMDFGFWAGMGYKLKKGKGMNLSVRYYYGLIDILRDESLRINPSGFYFNVGIPIGRGKIDDED